jgi:hypothetical protein
MALIADRQYLIASECEPSKAGAIRVYCTSGHNEPSTTVWASAKRWKVWAERDTTEEAPLGGPFWLSPDGKFLVFRSGVVLRLESDLDLTPDPAALKRMVAGPGNANRAAQAPAPRELIVGSVPRATEIKGLTFYLDCDKLTDDDTLIDAVSGKVGAKLGGTAERITGPRGRAVRLFTGPGGGTLAAQDQRAGLLIEPDLCRVGENKPFTLAFWARNGSDLTRFGCQAFFTRSAGKKSLSLGVYFGRQGPMFNSGGSPNGIVKVDQNEWNHYAFVRDEANRVDVWVNGERVPRDERQKEAGGPLDLTLLGVLDAGYRQVDLDEFCLFDRDLTAEELKRLAGRREK